MPPKLGALRRPAAARQDALPPRVDMRAGAPLVDRGRVAVQFADAPSQEDRGRSDILEDAQ